MTKTNIEAVDEARTFNAFVTAVKDSVENHAQRKNYTSGNADDDNQLLKVCVLLGIHDQHAIGEIIYKAVEFLKAPAKTKKVLMEKVAGWAFVIWRELPKESLDRGNGI